MPPIEWKSTKTLTPLRSLPENVELRELLEEILKNYVKKPGRIRVHPEIQNQVSTVQIKGRTMEGIFRLLLEIHERTWWKMIKAF